MSNEQNTTIDDSDILEITKYYSEWWENPKDIRNVVFNSLNELVKARIPPGNGMRALDIGSGRGRIVSYLVEKGYKVTAVDFNENFCNDLKNNFPGVNILQQDVRNLDLEETFDIVTCIELIQNLTEKETLELIKKFSHIGKTILINISNINSFHNRWAEYRGFKKNFVYNYSPMQFDKYLENEDFKIFYKRGIGFVTPVSLFQGFRGKIIPIWLAKMINILDPYLTQHCHLYYVEARNNALSEG